jgi:hypothetical protein
MSKHHHHPNEGHGPGNPPRSHLHQNWFFYVSGIFILIGLLAFIVWGSQPWKYSAPAPQQMPATGGSK